MEELNELKNLVMQNLEKNGALSNIRAQIRSSVFKTIDAQESSTKKVNHPSSQGLPFLLRKHQSPETGRKQRRSASSRVDPVNPHILQNGQHSQNLQLRIESENRSQTRRSRQKEWSRAEEGRTCFVHDFRQIRVKEQTFSSCSQGEEGRESSSNDDADEG